jgi:hypothetical protein
LDLGQTFFDRFMDMGGKLIGGYLIDGPEKFLTILFTVFRQGEETLGGVPEAENSDSVIFPQEGYKETGSGFSVQLRVGLPHTPRAIHEQDDVKSPGKNLRVLRVLKKGLLDFFQARAGLGGRRIALPENDR